MNAILTYKKGRGSQYWDKIRVANENPTGEEKEKIQVSGVVLEKVVREKKELESAIVTKVLEVHKKYINYGNG